MRLGTDTPRWSVPVSFYFFVATVITSVAAAARALAPVYRERLRLRFYRHIYDHGGRRDLKAAADALEARDGDEEQHKL